MSVTNAYQLYRTVVEDVINNVRESFLDDGVDEQILMELKQLWENKLAQTKAVLPDNVRADQEHMVTQFTLQSQAGQVGAAAKGRATINQSVAAGTVVQPTQTVQYHYAPAQGGSDVPKTVTITLPQTAGSGQKPLTITLPATVMQQAAAGGLVMSSSAVAAAQALPPNVAASLFQAPLTAINTAGVITHPSGDGTTISYEPVTAEQFSKHAYMVNVTPLTTQTPANNQANQIVQIDGANDTSDDDDDDDEFKDDDNDVDNDDEQGEDECEIPGEEEEPLNSEDDVSDDDPTDLFDTDNVIVCQFDKITRSRNKWKFHLKDGIMNLQGKDFVFQKASGDAEW